MFRPAPGAAFFEFNGKQYLEITIKSSNTFAKVLTNLQKKFDYFKDQSFLFYIANQFAVYPNALVRDIYSNFGTGGNLTINFSPTEIWG